MLHRRIAYFHIRFVYHRLRCDPAIAALSVPRQPGATHGKHFGENQIWNFAVWGHWAIRKFKLVKMGHMWQIFGQTETKKPGSLATILCTRLPYGQLQSENLWLYSLSKLTVYIFKFYISLQPVKTVFFHQLCCKICSTCTCKFCSFFVKSLYNCKLCYNKFIVKSVIGEE